MGTCETLRASAAVTPPPFQLDQSPVCHASVESSLRSMQPQSGREDFGSGLDSPDNDDNDDNDIRLEETSELPKSIPGRRGLVDFMSNLDVSHVGGGRESNIRELVSGFDKIHTHTHIYIYIYDDDRNK